MGPSKLRKSEWKKEEDTPIVPHKIIKLFQKERVFYYLKEHNLGLPNPRRFANDREVTLDGKDDLHNTSHFLTTCNAMANAQKKNTAKPRQRNPKGLLFVAFIMYYKIRQAEKISIFVG